MKVSRGIYWNSLICKSLVVNLLTVFCVFLVGQTATPAAARKHLAAAVDRTVKQGHDAVLPPHISNLLGLSPEEKQVPIKQLAEMGTLIRGFDVSAADHNDIVIFVEDRSKNETIFYLTSLKGFLRKVLSVQGGVGYQRTPTADDKKEFEKEKKYWLDHLAPGEQ